MKMKKNWEVPELIQLEINKITKSGGALGDEGGGRGTRDS